MPSASMEWVLFSAIHVSALYYFVVLSRERDKLLALLNARERCVLDKLSSASRETSDSLQNEDNNGKRNKSKEQVGEMAMIKVGTKSTVIVHTVNWVLLFSYKSFNSSISIL